MCAVPTTWQVSTSDKMSVHVRRSHYVTSIHEWQMSVHVRRSHYVTSIHEWQMSVTDVRHGYATCEESDWWCKTFCYQLSWPKRWLTRQTAQSQWLLTVQMAEEITVWLKIFPHSQMTERSVLYRLHAYRHDSCTLSSVCDVKVDSRYGNIDKRNAPESASDLPRRFGCYMLTISKMKTLQRKNPAVSYSSCEVSVERVK